MEGQEAPRTCFSTQTTVTVAGSVQHTCLGALASTEGRELPAERLGGKLKLISASFIFQHGSSDPSPTPSHVSSSRVYTDRLLAQRFTFAMQGWFNTQKSINMAWTTLTEGREKNT